MAHFAELDASSIVLRVLVVDNSVVLGVSDASNEHLGQQFLAVDMGLGGTWKQTSYNGNFRKNFAGVGYTYDAVRDAFIPPKPFPSWILDEATCRWVSPIPMLNVPASWDEATLSWIPR